MSGAPSRDATISAILETRQAAAYRTALGAVALLALIVGCAAAVGLLDVARLGRGVPAIRQLAAEMLPPDFTNAPKWVRPLLDTIAMSIAGTALAVGLSFPLAFLGARNTTIGPIAYQAARAAFNVLRAVPELVMGIVLVAAVGFGALPGVLALGLHSVGMVAKFFAEAIEHVDPRPVEAARAAGATEFQVRWHAVLPQVLPQLADITIYRWEYNFRASTIMGMVGAGGIGFELVGALRVMRYTEVSAVLLCILAMVMVVDRLGAALRRRLA